MSTNSTIAVKNMAGKYVAAYVHWDGYPDYMLSILKEHFSVWTSALKLVEGGDVSMIDRDGSVNYYAKRSEWDDYSTPSKDEKWENVKPIIFDSADDVIHHYDNPYTYIFENGKWNCYSEYADRDGTPFPEDGDELPIDKVDQFERMQTFISHINHYFTKVGEEPLNDEEAILSLEAASIMKALENK